MIVVQPGAAIARAVGSRTARRATARRVAPRTRRPRALALSDASITTTVPVSTLSQDDYNQQMLSLAQNQYQYLQYIWHEATIQRYIATAATVAIPVFATIWKWILKRRAG